MRWPLFLADAVYVLVYHNRTTHDVQLACRSRYLHRKSDVTYTQT